MGQSVMVPEARDRSELELREWMLRRAEPGTLLRDFTKEALDRHTDAGGIRCPLCEWQPRPSSRWCCSECPRPEGLLSGCGTLWNTFETSGVCPGCSHRWQWTSCLACGGWSLHVDWYASDESRP